MAALEMVASADHFQRDEVGVGLGQQLRLFVEVGQAGSEYWAVALTLRASAPDQTDRDAAPGSSR
jgi:hypothetical protein